MGTISDKLEYLNDTKGLLKDKINNLGGSITDETTFRQYVDQLDGVYDVLPKTEFQEGTSVTIENGLKGKLDFDDGKVGFGQASQESTNGYQLLPFTNQNTSGSSNGIEWALQDDGGIKIKGTSTAQVVIAYTRSQNMNLQAGTYIVSSTNFITNARFQIWYSTATLLKEIGQTAQTITISNDTTFENFRTQIVIPSGNTIDAVVYVQLEKGSTAKTFEKYTGGYASPSPNWEQTIQCVTGNQSIVESGKNMLYIADTIETTERGITKKSKDGVISLNGEASGSGSFTFGFFTLPKGTWKLSRNLTGTIASASWQNYIRDENNNNLVSGEGSFATDKDVRCQFYLWVNSGTDFQNVQMKPQLERGTETTTYEPYHTPITYPISLGSNKFYKIGDYADELLYDVENDKVYKKAYIGERLLRDVGQTGSSWNKSGLSTSDYFCGYIDFQFVMKADSHYILSNKLINQLYSDEPNDTECIANNALTVNIRIKASRLSENSVTGLVNYLQNEGSDIMIYFILNTPTLTELTDETLHAQVKALYNAHSNNGTTIITSNGDLPMIIKVRALKGE